MLDAQRYTVTRESLAFGTRHTVSADEEPVIQTTCRDSRVGTGRRFDDSDGRPSLRVEPFGNPETPEYTVADERTGEHVGTFSRNTSAMFGRPWHLHGPDGDLLATIEAAGRVRAFARSTLNSLAHTVSLFQTMIPPRFTIRDVDGEVAGAIRGAPFSNQYRFELAAKTAPSTGTGGLDPRLVVPAVVVLSDR